MREQYENAATKLREVLESLVKKIEEGPDNPRIRRISQQAFIMRAGDLGQNWSAQHHDFKAAYHEVAQALRQAAPGRAMIVLQEIVKTGKVGGLRLHADVITYLRTLLLGTYEEFEAKVFECSKFSRTILRTATGSPSPYAAALRQAYEEGKTVKQAVEMITALAWEID